MLEINNTMKAYKGQHEYIIYYYLNISDSKPFAFMFAYASSLDNLYGYMNKYILQLTQYYEIIPTGKTY